MGVEVKNQSADSKEAIEKKGARSRERTKETGYLTNLRMTPRMLVDGWGQSSDEVSTLIEKTYTSNVLSGRNGLLKNLPIIEDLGTNHEHRRRYTLLL